MITLYGCVALLTLASTPAGAGPPTEAPAKAAPFKDKRAAPQKTGSKTSGPAPTNPAANADGVLERVQRYYAELKDYSAEFIQTYRRVALSRTSESRGKLELKKPGLMRWTYEKPEEKLWIIDGKKLWVTDPEQQQVYVNESFKTAEMTNAISFLWGKGRLDETFSAKLGDPLTYDLPKDRAALELVPKKGATYTKLVLGVDRVSGEVTESILFETAGNINRFKFRNARLNTGIPDSRFTFVAPLGWDVIQQ